MLQVGRLGCSSHTSGCGNQTSSPALQAWSRAHFAAFAIVSSPLVLSIHPSDENLDPILDIIGNKLAINVSETWAGHPGSIVRTLPPAALPNASAGGNSVVGIACDKTDKTQLGFTYDAAASAIKHKGLCLTSAGFTLPLTLTACGNKSKGSYQNFTFDPKAKTFNSISSANGPILPCCLQMMATATPAPTKVDVYRCRPGASQQFAIDATDQVISGVGAKECLAGRDQYKPPPAGVAPVALWAKPLGKGRVAALFINGGALNYSATISMAELNVTGTSVSAIDVWTGEAPAGAGVVDGKFATGVVPPMESRFLIFGSK